jgi:diguanylate cyclase (GGDEF)-like protein
MRSISSTSEPPLILIVDDQNTTRQLLRQKLQEAGYRVAEAKNGEEGLRAYHYLRPDMVLLDAIMPVMDGFTCCTLLQTSPELHHVPILIITGLGDPESVDRAFAAGANDFVTKPIHWPVLIQRVRRLLEQAQLYRELEAANQALEQSNRELEAANKSLAELVSLDSLTQLANRRCFDERLAWEWRRMGRQQNPISLILADVDCFKSYNDTYGHHAGDICLQQVAATIRSVVKRPADLVARYGGEEFVVILPNTEEIGAVKVAEEIRLQINALQIPHAHSLVGSHVTLSTGVASMIPQITIPPVTLIISADQALYRAKKEGRDRVVLNRPE